MPHKRPQRARKSLEAGSYRAGQLVERKGHARALWNKKSNKIVHPDDIGIGFIIGEWKNNPNFVEVLWQKCGIRETIHKSYISLYTTIERKDVRVYIPRTNEQSKD